MSARLGSGLARPSSGLSLSGSGKHHHHDRRGASGDTLAAGKGRSSTELVGEEAPDFEIELVREGREAGERVRISDIVSQKKPVLITFYSSFSPECDVLGQELDGKVDFYAGRANLLLVNCDAIKLAQEFGAAKGPKRCMHGAGEVPSEYKVVYYPHRTLIGRDGRVLLNVGARGFQGFSWADLDRALTAETMWCLADCGRPLLGTYPPEVHMCKACCKLRGLALPMRESRGMHGLSTSTPVLAPSSSRSFGLVADMHEARPGPGWLPTLAPSPPGSAPHLLPDKNPDYVWVLRDAPMVTSKKIRHRVEDAGAGMRGLPTMTRQARSTGNLLRRAVGWKLR
eukprot:TRINITY_DN18221_c0_g1_i2.p1 TRINITY_DN18221_c0_g1~~TRINITY_DN18221_c0_g1_i2.p1  ORF type:complete len:341 (+),score=46.90 TRINITY_DN18221_c0_g1_i2:37-1059(+)